MLYRIAPLVALALLAAGAAFAVEPASLADAVRTEIERRGTPGNFRVELSAVPPGLAGEGGPAYLTELQLEARSGRFAASFSHGQNYVTTVAGRMIELMEVPMLAHNLDRGDIVAAEDLVWTEIPATRVGPGIATDLARLIGTEARRGLRAGEPLRSADLRTPLMVRKGGLVTLSYSTDTMRLTLSGRALSEGVLGDVVRVLNLQSSRVVEAVIDGKDSAVVRAPDRLATN